MTAARHIAHIIQYLKHKEIDFKRWNDCVRNSSSPLIYGHSGYLDQMAAGQWDALVLDDYKAVMPLTWRSKFGITYLYQPAFTQQTGIFSTELLTASVVEAFLHELDRHFQFAESHLNYSNAIFPLPPHSPFTHLSPLTLLSTLTARTNYILSLDLPYEQLASQYKKDLVRNLKAAARTPLLFVKDFALETALGDFRGHYASRLPAIRQDDYRHFERLCLDLRQQGQLLVRAVLDEQRHPLGSAVFLRDTHRFYLVHSTTFAAGRTTESNHFLLDQFIREFAGTPMTLDFEGSDHPGIAHFYANFGSTNQPYFFYRRNRLPWPFRWLK
jgi:hypothetical protein